MERGFAIRPGNLCFPVPWPMLCRCSGADCKSALQRTRLLPVGHLNGYDFSKKSGSGGSLMHKGSLFAADHDFHGGFTIHFHDGDLGADAGIFVNEVGDEFC